MKSLELTVRKYWNRFKQFPNSGENIIFLRKLELQKKFQIQAKTVVFGENSKSSILKFTKNIIFLRKFYIISLLVNILWGPAEQMKKCMNY